MTAQNNQQDSPIVLTLTIPVDGTGIVKMVGSKGDVSKIWAVTYGDQNDLAAAVHTAAWELVNLELAPPPKYDPPSMPGKARKADPAPAQQPQPEAGETAQEPPDDIHTAGDATESAAVDEVLDESLAEEPDETEVEEFEEEEAGGGGRPAADLPDFIYRRLTYFQPGHPALWN